MMVIKRILTVREILISYIKRCEPIVVFLLKFLAGLFIFSCVNKIGLYREELAPLYEGFLSVPVWLMMGVLFAVLPPALAQALVMLNVTAQISMSLETAALALMIMLLIVVFHTRVSPGKSFLIIAIILGFQFNIPYAVVLFAGLYCGLGGIVPVTIGTFIYEMLPFFKRLLTERGASAELGLMDMPTAFLEVFQLAFAELTGNLNWIVIAFVFAMVIIGVYAVSLLNIDYGKEIAICGGGVLGMVCMLLCSSIAQLDMAASSIVLGSLASIVLMEVVRFFDCVLDYRRVEHVQFEDEECYYYVKIVPKLKAEALDESDMTAVEDTRGERPPRVPSPGPVRRAPRPEPGATVAAPTERMRRPTGDAPRTVPRVPRPAPPGEAAEAAPRQTGYTRTPLNADAHAPRPVVGHEYPAGAELARPPRPEARRAETGREYPAGAEFVRPPSPAPPRRDTSRAEMADIRGRDGSEGED